MPIFLNRKGVPTTRIPTISLYRFAAVFWPQYGNRGVIHLLCMLGTFVAIFITAEEGTVMKEEYDVAWGHNNTNKTYI